MKIIVYTCITGNYDNLIELSKKENNVEYICFTNNKDLKSKTWKIIHINEELDNWTLARKVKILSYKYLPKHDLSIWVDGAISILIPVTKFIDKECELDKYDMVGFRHQDRDCIYDEISACVELEKETIENSIKIENFLKSEKYPKHNGLIESTVLIRKNNSRVNKLMDSWFNMIKTYSRRDQLSFDYCLWKNPIKIKYLDMWVFDNKYFKHVGHRKIEYLNYRLIFDNAQPFDYHNAVDSRVVINSNNVVIEHTCIKDTQNIVLLLPNDIGSTIRNPIINNKEDSYVFLNTRAIDSNNFFYNTPTIIFNGEFCKNQKIVIEFQLYRNSEGYLVEELYKKDLQNKELTVKANSLQEEIDRKSHEYEQLKNEYLNVINSRTWKLAEKMRKVRRAVINK